MQIYDAKENEKQSNPHIAPECSIEFWQNGFVD